MERIFAYGSNMRVEQMRARCPSAKRLGTVRLPRASLEFVGYSWTWGGGVATIADAKASSVTGVMYSVTGADLDVLDRYEGTPLVYSRGQVAVTDLARGKRSLAWAYFHSRPDDISAPSYRYFAALVAGAVCNGLDPHPIVAAAERAAGGGLTPKFSRVVGGGPNPKFST